MYYHFGRIARALRIPRAMEADIANHVCLVEELAGLAY
jgi:hypothetical protein